MPLWLLIGNYTAFRSYMPGIVDEDHIFLIHSVVVVFFFFSFLIWLKEMLLLGLLNDV